MSQTTTPYKGFFLNKYRVWHHILFWIATIIFALTLMHAFSEKTNYTYFITNLIISCALIYFNTIVLLPKYLAQGKSIPYVSYTTLSVAAGLTISILIISVINKEFPFQDWHYFLSKHLYTTLVLIVSLIAAIGFHFFKEQINSIQKIDLLEKSKLEAELDFLKMQMNPHFLFNTLNGISTLTKTNPDKAYNALIQLSDLLRFQTYECSGNLVLLSSEINYIKKYLELQSLRFPDTKIEFELIGEITGLTIFPFIFLTFVENAVKHGIEKVKDNVYLRIVIEILNKKVIFFVENTKSSIQTSNNEGVGLKNVKRRLELLYSGNYKLEIEDQEDKYIVKLKLNLTQ